MKSERIEAILEDVRGQKVLNLGCVGHKLPSTAGGKDHWLHYQLCERFPGAEVLGIDIDKENVERMRSMGFKAEVGDAQQLGYERSFDTIILGELIEHLENPGACLTSCVRALKRGGRIVISTPNAFCAMLGLMYLKNFDKAFNPEHVVWFCPQTLRALLGRCGLRLTRLKFTDDLAPDIDPKPIYRIFAYSWLGVRRIFPTRYRNTMVATCEPERGARLDSVGKPGQCFNKDLPREELDLANCGTRPDL